MRGRGSIRQLSARAVTAGRGGRSGCEVQGCDSFVETKGCSDFLMSFGFHRDNDAAGGSDSLS